MNALEDIYRRKRGVLLSIARENGIPPHAAGDVLHDSLLAVLTFDPGKFDSPRGLYRYLCKAVRLRSRGVRYHEVVREPVERPQAPEVLNRITVERAWAALTPQERVAIAHLHILEDDVSRADLGVFAARIRVARKRLG